MGPGVEPAPDGERGPAGQGQDPDVPAWPVGGRRVQAEDQRDRVATQQGGGGTMFGKKFYFVANENCNCSECPYMKLNTLEKLHDCMANLAPQIELSAEVLRRARLPIERMLEISARP